MTMKTNGGTFVIALVPAHNEEKLIVSSVEGLLLQTRAPDLVVVVADNCTDSTVQLVMDMDDPAVTVFETSGNTSKKAGALNQALRTYLPGLSDDDIVMVQDADSILDKNFVANAVRHVEADPSLGAVGGTFRAVAADDDATRWTRFLVHLQDNEYARYARDVRRLNGKCLVVTGTASVFRASTLNRVSMNRLEGTLPKGDGDGGIYDTTVLTEDNELSFAIMSIGMKLYAPSDCLLVTDAMTSLKDLWNQRLRWKRGAVENCIQYGITRVTLPYWGRQALTFAGILVSLAYLSSLVYSFALEGGITVHPFWLGVTGIFLVERFVTLRDKELKWRFLAATMYELPYDLFLQASNAKAYFDSITMKERVW